MQSNPFEQAKKKSPLFKFKQIIMDFQQSKGYIQGIGQGQVHRNDHVKQGWLRSCLQVYRQSGSITIILVRKSNSISFIFFRVQVQLGGESSICSLSSALKRCLFCMAVLCMPTMEVTFLKSSSSLCAWKRVCPVTMKWKTQPSAHISTGLPQELEARSSSGARQKSEPTMLVMEREWSSSLAMPQSMILRWQLLVSMSVGSGCERRCVFLEESMMLDGFRSR